MIIVKIKYIQCQPDHAHYYQNIECLQMVNKISIGQLNRSVQLFDYVETVNETGEAERVATLYKKKWATAVDVGSDEREDGKIFLNGMRQYFIRFDLHVALDGEKMMVRDFDGDYNIGGIEIIGKKQYLKLKAAKYE